MFSIFFLIFTFLNRWYRTLNLEKCNVGINSMCSVASTHSMFCSQRHNTTLDKRIEHWIQTWSGFLFLPWHNAVVEKTCYVHILLTACLSTGWLWHSEGGSVGHQQPHHQREERPGELGFGTNGLEIWSLFQFIYCCKGDICYST